LLNSFILAWLSFIKYPAIKTFINGKPRRISKREIGAFICDACGLKEEATFLRTSSARLSYRGIADFLVARSTAQSDRDKIPYSVALQALLYEKGIESSSLESIKDAIFTVNGEAISDSEFDEIRNSAVSENENPVLWRERIYVFVTPRLFSRGSVSSIVPKKANSKTSDKRPRRKKT
jgi:hypothetical protein